jgi:sugar phosphate isomerase/epimerase
MAKKESLANRLAVCSWSLHPKDPGDLIAQLKQLGMDKIQLALGPVLSDPKWADAGQQLADAGIRIVSGMFGTVGEDYSTLETIRRTGGVVPDATWETNWASIRKLAPVATALGVRLVSFHAGFLPEDPGDPAYDKLVSRLSRIADLFGEAVIDLAFETGQEDCRTLRGFLDRLNKSNVGANFDPANMILYGKGDPVESVKALAGYVKSVHVKDALPAATPGAWGKEVAVGTGAVDWVNFFAALNAGKFTGYLCIEREAGEQRIADITTAKKFLLNTFAKVK